MTFEQYQQSAQRAADLVDQKNYAQAVEVLQSLVESDLPPIDRSVMSINVATVCDLMGHVDHALAWYDHGISLEQPLMRCFAAQRKAEYLAVKGRKAEARAMYERLVSEPYLSLQETESLRLAVLAMGQ